MRRIEVRESARTESESQARTLLRRRLREVNSASYVGPTNEKLTVSDVLDAYLAHRMPHVKNQNALEYAVRFLREFFGTRRAAMLFPEQIDAARAKMCEAGYAQGTVDRVFRILRAAYHLAQTDRKVAHVPRISMYAPEDARQGFCEPDEFWAIHAQIAHPVVKDMAEFAYYSGRRPSELEKMRWSDVYRDEGVVRLPRTKNRKPWIVVLEGPLAEIVERRSQARVEGVTLSEYVFHESGQRIHSSKRNRWWKKACVAAGYPNRLFYDLRRTAARDMIDAGADVTTVKQALGHTTDSMLHRYNIRTTTDQREAVQRMVELRQGKRGQSHGHGQVVALKITG